MESTSHLTTFLNLIVLEELPVLKSDAFISQHHILRCDKIQISLLFPGHDELFELFKGSYLFAIVFLKDVSCNMFFFESILLDICHLLGLSKSSMIY